MAEERKICGRMPTRSLLSACVIAFGGAIIKFRFNHAIRLGKSDGVVKAELDSTVGVDE